MRMIMLAVVATLLWSAPAQARPAGCPSMWCACWMAMQLGYSAVQAKAMGLWRARTFAEKYPRTAAAPGMVAVFARGRGGGHVGRIVAVHPGRNSITMISGNDGNRVRTRERSLRGLIAVVNPYSSYIASKPAAKTRVAYAKRKVRKRSVIVRRSIDRPAVQYAHAAS